MNRYPNAFTVLKIAGAAYVFWIAWKLSRSGTPDQSQKAKPASFVDGVVLLLLNPKAYVIIALMFTQFLDQDENAPFIAVLFITTLFTINNFVAFTIWSIAGDRMANHCRSENSAAKLNLFFGLVLAAVAVWMLLV